MKMRARKASSIIIVKNELRAVKRIKKESIDLAKRVEHIK